MGNKLISKISTSQLAERLGLLWRGRNTDIEMICPLDTIKDGGLCFTKSDQGIVFSSAATVIAPHGTEQGQGSIIESNNPRLDFAKALNLLLSNPGFVEHGEPANVATNAVVSQSAFLGRGVYIGARSIIGHNVVITDGVSIGTDCIIKSNTVIGEAGFGFERDEKGIPIRILHLGSVVIGNRVEIGSLNTVCRGTLGDTIIGDDVKTDDHVHIAHNCRVGRGALLTACVELSGGVEVGAYSWIGPNSSIIQKIKLGVNSFIGIASNVTKSVPDGASVAGNPARIFKIID